MSARKSGRQRQKPPDVRRAAEEHFVKSAGHELRTPVAAIASAVEVLQGGAKENPAERDRFLAHIAAATARLEQLIEALLVLARAQAGDASPALAPVLVRPLLERVAGELKPAVGVAVQTKAARDLAALGHRAVIEQLVSNLAMNAARHTDAGRIELVAEPGADGTVVIEVRDTGRGIAPDDQVRIKEQLARRDSPEVEGRGIGLTIVREAVRALGGSVEIESAPERGTTAMITLPRADASAGR